MKKSKLPKIDSIEKLAEFWDPSNAWLGRETGSSFAIHYRHW